MKKLFNQNLQSANAPKRNNNGHGGGKNGRNYEKQPDSRLDFSVKASVALVLKGTDFEKTTFTY